MYIFSSSLTLINAIVQAYHTADSEAAAANRLLPDLCIDKRNYNLWWYIIKSIKPWLANLLLIFLSTTYYTQDHNIIIIQRNKIATHRHLRRSKSAGRTTKHVAALLSWARLRWL